MGIGLKIRGIDIERGYRLVLEQFFQKIHLSDWIGLRRQLQVQRNNPIEFMDLPRSFMDQSLKDFDLRNPLEGTVQDKSYRNDRIFWCPENAMRCSEMVEVVE